ncbi:MAG TPA: ABC transporter ATP-binding protein [Candidatus Borkfalkia excrementigallinarum]|uniref:ABC transporter ATP-binding protein n=1 Tax=Candidatus Borkfalkia excrementigallinarum TaxID=2838506 RepID=A0A9D2CSG7_9FIRM|nr:ABC transporter ATP-binding protein [Candidatus Borkfalkia excrementigallinarum]
MGKKEPLREDCLMELKNVTMKFVKYDVGVNSLKELVVRAFKGDLKREKFVCLKNISFSIRKGESVAIIGRNGVGKSTLLKIMSGILKPTSGTVRCNGRITPLLKLGAGFDPNATGVENIYLNAAIMGYTKKEIDEKLPAILEFSELGDFIYSPIKTYSSGMMARLGFSIAVHMDSEILLIDEILAVGDMAFQKKCYAKLDELREKGLVFLIVSHSSSVQRYCKRALWLERGRLIADGDTAEIFARYTEMMNKKM